MLLKKFLDDDFSEIYLWQIQSLICIFQRHIQEIERENNAVVEVKKILDKVHTMLHEYKTNKFMPLKVKGMLAQKQEDGFGQKCDHVNAEIQGMYSTCLVYFERWMAPREGFSTFMWMDLGEILD
ncbi:unnamed protein product [Lepeophtheirus salmonis]|uniref:(salmon louse) hypothetical protein n=1 Tax=Lepeophtheirus salmonis TaxID=72036 RepID=A0A7R8HAT7_LEPSM|nr:unnamed protein product [Lepeophtheirus salmonis]CAF2980261.1 unnamed protein product [Lepeophtheirus salmonis]